MKVTKRVRLRLFGMSFLRRLSEFIATSYKFETTYIYSEEWSYNIGLNYYDQDTGLSAFYTTFGLKYLY